ncbi:MAG: Gfo/Idh/MocA family oxidoreductase [Alphaproteobacteria bacterium]|nr:Gfo/Idh/MocA family oxidoreductase [Alphaproteobacteria bacterium]MCB9929326.1 Gfo/Idh/MocA family oxidoreductase [Alphaproteobacteria bacterium]
MTDSPIRIGLIGAGGNVRSRHIPGFRQQSGVEIVAVANRTRASGQAIADEFGIARVYDGWPEVLADPEVDAVCIGTWPYMHRTLTVAALEAGKHVMCEARMAMNLSDARHMLAAARKRPDLVAQIVPAPHTLAFDRTIREMVAGGAVGDIIAVDARIAAARAFPDASGPVHWRQDRDLSGNNIMNMGIWYEAMMRWVGPMKTVMAVGQSVVKHRLDADGHRVAMRIPDHIDVIGELEQGGQMRFNVSSVVGHMPSLADVHIFGTDGTIRLHQPVGGAMALSAGKRGDADLSAVAIDPARQGGWRVEEEFVNAIRGREPITHTDFVTGCQYMEWTDAVTLSLRQRRTVTLPL